jgi:O-antigen ligase
MSNSLSRRPGLLARGRDAALLAVFALLPLVGLVAGPSYAPLLFGLAVLSCLSRLAAARRDWPRLDRILALISLLFLGLCALGLSGSVAPAVTATKLLQLGLILLGCLLLLTQPPPQRLARLFQWLLMASALGVLLLCADTVMGYPLQRWLSHGAANAATKYNRGVIALVLLAWPLLAYFMVAGKRRHALLLAALAVLAVTVGLSSTGVAALVAGAVIWVLALIAPRATAALLGGGMAILALALPFALSALQTWRERLAPILKSSGLHRLEIWDYMSLRIQERPWTGWGLGAANWVPVPADGLLRYRYVSPDGVYPHNQWVELWLETGLPGVLLGLSLVALVLWRCRGVPLAMAALASALAVSLLNFEITTDSWWAALAATALLFKFQFPTRNM